MTRIPDCMAHLPVYAGRPVPWIAMWTDEAVGPGITMGPTGIEVADRPEYAIEMHGFWWMTAPDNMTGRPDFAGTQARRQRECMSGLICQVCGRGPEQTGDWPIWTAPRSTSHNTLAERGMFVNAPTCLACIVAATDFCPNLHRETPAAWTGRLVEVVGADVSRFDGEAMDETRGFILLDEPYRRFCLGRQYVVVVRDRKPFDLAPLIDRHRRNKSEKPLDAGWGLDL